LSLDMRHTLEAFLPPGPIWYPAPEGDFDDLLDGMGENAQRQYESFSDLRYVREPLFTPILKDLEKEYGILTQDNLSEEDRRSQLHSRVYARPGFGLDYMQERIQAAGFDLVVQANDPAVDPALLLGNQYWTVAGGSPGVGGFPVQWAGYYTNPVGPPIYESIAGYKAGGELLVNGKIFAPLGLAPDPYAVQVPNYLCCAGFAGMVAGSRYAYAGYFLSMLRRPVEYPIPPLEKAGYWPLIFFVAKSFSGWDQEPPDPRAVPGDVPATRVPELKRIILRHKPLHTWCGLIINYI